MAPKSKKFKEFSSEFVGGLHPATQIRSLSPDLTGPYYKAFGTEQ